jgi:hypothetical protein
LTKPNDATTAMRIRAMCANKVRHHHRPKASSTKTLTTISFLTEMEHMVLHHKIMSPNSTAKSHNNNSSSSSSSINQSSNKSNHVLLLDSTPCFQTWIDECGCLAVKLIVGCLVLPLMRCLEW